MTIDEFINKYLNQKVELFGDPKYQCVDLVEMYNKEVIGAPALGGNAADFSRNPRPNYYEYFVNHLWYIPPRGAIAIWNKNVGEGNGHCGVVLEASLMKFNSLDQNWPTGSPTAIIQHSYKNVQGFLVPRPQNILTVYNTLVEELRTITTKYTKV